MRFSPPDHLAVPRGKVLERNWKKGRKKKKEGGEEIGELALGTLWDRCPRCPCA